MAGNEYGGMPTVADVIAAVQRRRAAGGQHPLRMGGQDNRAKLIEYLRSRGNTLGQPGAPTSMTLPPMDLSGQRPTMNMPPMDLTQGGGMTLPPMTLPTGGGQPPGFAMVKKLIDQGMSPEEAVKRVQGGVGG